MILGSITKLRGLSSKTTRFDEKKAVGLAIRQVWISHIAKYLPCSQQ